MAAGIRKPKNLAVELSHQMRQPEGQNSLPAFRHLLQIGRIFFKGGQPMEDLMGIDAPDRFQVAIRGRAHDFARHDNRSDPSFWTSRFHSSINKRSFANLCTS